MKKAVEPELRVPYTQQFSPEQTPLKRLLPLLRANAKKGKSTKLRAALASAFFKTKTDPGNLAGNTLIALRQYGIIADTNELTDFGMQLLALQGRETEAQKLLAGRILFEFNGITIVETLREMAGADLPINLTSLPEELRHRGLKVSKNSSDLSGVLNWLRAAGVLSNYTVDQESYKALVGAAPATMDAAKGLSSEQIAFLRAMVALNVNDWTPYDGIVKHAESLYSGEIHYNWKDIPALYLKGLADAGLIEIRKKAKQGKTPAGRGGKTADVRPTEQFTKQFADPLLNALYRSAGFRQIREIRSKSLDEIVADIRQKKDTDKSGKALELLAIRLCQMLDLEFMGWRETDVEVAGGGEVDAMLESSRLIYSRWQVQCKIGQINLPAIAKEIGMQTVTLASVILIVGTGRITASAETFRQKQIRTSNLNIIFIEGADLEKIIKDNSALLAILSKQAKDALNLKPKVTGLKGGPPSEQGGANGSEPSEADRENTGWVEARPAREFRPSYTTGRGQMYCGDALEVLPWLIQRGYRAKLIHTSPPFALVRKKEYGNEDSDSYLQWFEQFIPYFKQILEPGGSLVIDIGGSWIKGLPVKSIYHFKVLVKLCESGFYLAQDFYHYNPARLPTPAEWVTVRRIRVKDATNNVWWLTLDPFVDADNRRVLAPYSDSMKSLLKNGYKPGLRPSGHNISSKFQRDNGGAIPPNLLHMPTSDDIPDDVLPFSNTDSQGHYLRRCKEENLSPHPARFPHALPEFFINFLTKPGDLILDPFAGSNVTGAAAERLGRQWIGIELDQSYVTASQFRFEAGAMIELERPQATTRVAETLPLFSDSVN